MHFQHKRGDTFAPSFSYVEDDGKTPASLAGYGIRSQIRDTGGNLVHTFVFEVTNITNGEYKAQPADTLHWPLGMMQIDIEYTVNGFVVSTETQEFELVKKVTKPA